MIYKSGRLSYRRKSTGEERGHEDFTLTNNRDGTRTMRCLAMTDDSKFVRDATLTLGADARPQDVFVRLQVNAELVGTGYFHIFGDELNIVTDARVTGRTHQKLIIPTDFFAITTHAVMLDGWAFFNYDIRAGGEQRRAFYNTSTRWDGTDGPLGKLETYRIEHLGEEEMSVPAGTFPVQHFKLEPDFLDVPTSHVYVTGPDNLLIKYDWAGLDLEYVLADLKQEQRGFD